MNAMNHFKKQILQLLLIHSNPSVTAMNDKAISDKLPMMPIKENKKTHINIYLIGKAETGSEMWPVTDSAALR